MKSLLSASFFFCVLVIVAADSCVEQAECDASQCCAGIPFLGGLCQNFTAEGGKCHLVDKVVPIFGDFYVGPCPCAEGLECVQQGKKKNDGICQKPLQLQLLHQLKTLQKMFQLVTQLPKNHQQKLIILQ
ncbi:prokineticin domain-containing protein [Trichonephila inaurata madagascariensis]|uniref:Prokineticin domain-containing protein n=1 Tax=Trichonephila inaurata madagascariensis TaxID=2747483 RepID=A0A8X7C7V0_9ARAC|nr:prokineticin domain-containing protein [Trichonephila inaurata madagascariensis]